MDESNSFDYSPNDNNFSHYDDDNNSNYNLAVFMIKNMENDISIARGIVSSNNSEFNNIQQLNINISSENESLKV